MTKILLVEDSPAISEPLEFLLEREGYSVTVTADGAEALTLTEHSPFDLMLLDLMLPSLSGTEVCKKVREFSDMPIIMLTAKDSEADIVLGLEVGADDYVTKPYSSGELLARVRAALRRTTATEDHTTDRVEYAGVAIDTTAHTVSVNGEDLHLPLKEFDLLSYLMMNADRVLTRGQLLEYAWGSDYYGDTKTLDVHIKRLRAKIEDDPKHPQRLTTVRGLGYKFNAHH